VLSARPKLRLIGGAKSGRKGRRQSRDGTGQE
jgi:hypothetical protein